MNVTLFRDVEVDGRVVDVEVVAGVVHRIDPARGASRPADAVAPDTEVVRADGAALLPGLHDHHVHLAALAAAMSSVPVGPPAVTDEPGLVGSLRAAALAAPPGRWVRAVGYHDSVAGPLDRDRLDRIVADRPVRVQHRSGLRWILNSAGLDAVGTDEGGHPGVEVDRDGRPTGCIDRADDWLASRIADSAFPDLTAVGRRLARLGVVGVTDCTPYATLDGPAAIAAAVAAGHLPQRVVLTGGPALAGAAFPAEVGVGPVKVVLDEHDLGDLDDLVATFRAAHDAGRPVAVHLVTAAATAFALAAWQVAGSAPGDRIEHGSVLTGAMVPVVAALGLTVVTQPGFVAERGDQYLADVDADEIDDLYRCGSLLAAGVPVAGSTDTPYTDPDPWRAVAAAVHRRTPAGRTLGPGEAVPPAAALGLFLGDAHRPARRRRVEVGAPADLCLLRCGLDEALARPSASNVAATYRAGRPIGGVATG